MLTFVSQVNPGFGSRSVTITPRGLEGSAAPGRSTCSTVFAKTVLYICVCDAVQCVQNLYMNIFIKLYLSFASWLWAGWAGGHWEISVTTSRHDMYLSTGCNSQAVMWVVIVVPACWYIAPKVIFLCTDVKARHVFHILGHVCPGYMSVIFSYLSYLCEGEGKCAIAFYSSSGYAQEYLCKEDHFTLLLVCLVSFNRMSRKSYITSDLVLTQALCVHIHARTHVRSYCTF